MFEAQAIVQNLKVFFSENWKVFAFASMTVLATIASVLAHKLVVKTRTKNNKKNFANPMYSIGAAIVNMERAVYYSDENNFKFFARYAIRLCLGMPKSYPPDEPSADEILSILKKTSADEDLIKKSIEIYSIVELPNDENEWSKIISETRLTVKKLLSQQNY